MDRFGRDRNYWMEVLAARTVKMHQGAIKVESQPGVGTKFILTLPRSFPKNIS